jgi:hypothetical protein
MDPGQNLDVIIEADLGAFTKVWTGYSRLENAESEALRTGFRRKPDSVPMIADSQ